MVLAQLDNALIKKTKNGRDLYQKQQLLFTYQHKEEEIFTINGEKKYVIRKKKVNTFEKSGEQDILCE